MAAWLPFSLLHTSGKEGFRSGLRPRLPVSPGELTQEFIFMSSTLVQDVWTVRQMFIQVTQERTAEQGCVQQDRRWVQPAALGCISPPQGVLTSLQEAPGRKCTRWTWAHILHHKCQQTRNIQHIAFQETG